MYSTYLEAKPSVMSDINIVPMIGVLAALLIMVMTALPTLTQAFSPAIGWSCGGSSPFHEHQLEIHISSNGTTSIEGESMTQQQITDTVTAALKQDNHIIVARLDIDIDSNYQDVMSVISNLRASGIQESKIQILDN